MKKYAFRARQMAVSLADETQSERAAPTDRVTWASLLVATLATIAALVQSVVLYLQADTPYTALVYQEQVRRSVEAVDFMAVLRADVVRWESINAANKMNEQVLDEVEAKMIAFAGLSETAWLMSPRAQTDIGVAARDFNNFSVRCLRPRYIGMRTIPSDCDKVFTVHQDSLDRAMKTALDDVKFEYRRQRPVDGESVFPSVQP